MGTGTEGSSSQNSENITNLYTEEEDKEPWKAGGPFVIEAKHKSTEVNKPPLGRGKHEWDHQNGDDFGKGRNYKEHCWVMRMRVGIRMGKKVNSFTDGTAGPKPV